MDDTQVEQGTDEQGNENSDPATRSAQVLQEILQLMGYDEVSVNLASDGDRIKLNIDGDEAGALVGKKGQTLDALQFVLGRIMNKQEGLRQPIVIDDGGYRERRGEALLKLADHLSEEAVRTGKTLAVNPMSAHDRRIIHMALKEHPQVNTRSEGDGTYRRLLIIPS